MRLLLAALPHLLELRVLTDCLRQILASSARCCLTEAYILTALPNFNNCLRSAALSSICSYTRQNVFSYPWAVVVQQHMMEYFGLPLSSFVCENTWQRCWAWSKLSWSLIRSEDYMIRRRAFYGCFCFSFLAIPSLCIFLAKDLHKFMQYPKNRGGALWHLQSESWTTDLFCIVSSIFLATSD